MLILLTGLQAVLDRYFSRYFLLMFGIVQQQRQWHLVNQNAGRKTDQFETTHGEEVNISQINNLNDSILYISTVCLKDLIHIQW